MLLKIRITEQFSGFEDIGLGIAEPGGCSRQGLSALQTGDNAEPPPALSKLRSQEQARNDGTEALGGICSACR